MTTRPLIVFNMIWPRAMTQQLFTAYKILATEVLPIVSRSLKHKLRSWVVLLTVTTFGLHSLVYSPQCHWINFEILIEI